MYKTEIKQIIEEPEIGIISHSIKSGFYNIKIKIKEGYFMVESYRTFLAELQEEMNTIQNIDVSAEVTKKLNEIKEQIEDDEYAKKEKAIIDKQLEIDATTRIIERLEHEAIELTTDSENEQEEE